jgi:hypothetical protein
MKKFRKRILKLWIEYWEIFHWEYRSVDYVTGRAIEETSLLGFIIGFLIMPIWFPIYMFFKY